jgi:outer membrane protein OmpA-like peptidoglycan-associated protein
MKRIMVTATVLAWAAGPALADERVLDLSFETVALVVSVEDLVFSVEDLTGNASGLAVAETDTEIRIELSGDVLFDFDSSDIRPEAEPALANAAEVLRLHPRANVEIGGHTDSVGSDSYNMRLSRQRAEAVRDWLVAKGGVEADRLTARGHGRASPIAPNTRADGSDHPEGRQLNRRVEISVRK